LPGCTANRAGFRHRLRNPKWLIATGMTVSLTPQFEGAKGGLRALAVE